MADLKDIFSNKNTHREAAPDVNRQEFIQLVKSRRSVRKYTSEKLSEQDMRECLELALLAPNSSNLQPWEFYWIREASKRKLVNAAFLGQPAATTASDIVVAVARTSTWKKNAKQMIEILEANPESKGASVYYKKLVPLAYTIGFLGIVGYIKKVILFVQGLTKPVPREVTSKAELQIWATKTTALACENLMLAIRAYGYDSCPMEGMDSHRLKKILNLPSDAVVVMGISAGKRAADGVYGPQLRLDSSNFIFEV